MSIFRAWRMRLARWLASSDDAPVPAEARSTDLAFTEVLANDMAAAASVGHVALYDENLYERIRTQWQFGDWGSLASIKEDMLWQHPERAKLALMVAAGHLQLGNAPVARRFVQLARQWGCSKKLLGQVLIAGVHNSLGRAAAIGDQRHRAQEHFRNAIAIGTPGSDTRLLAQARSGQQLAQVGLEQRADGRLHLVTSSATSLAANTPDTVGTADRARYLNHNGEELYKAGNFKLALEYFERAFELAPDNAWYCQNLAEAAARLEQKKGEQWECEALGKSMDENGKWDVAVRHYRRALQLDAAKVAEHQNQQKFALEPADAGQVASPVFVVGCGHSGTSLMLAILGSHSHIHPVPKESALFLQTDANLQKALRTWDAECKVQGKLRWVEKTPPHIFQIHRFLAFRPKAKFVLMLRDGRDVVCSLKQRIGYTAFQDRLDRWVYDNLAAERYWTHPQVKLVKYEDLVTDTEAVLRDLCHFLGEEYQAGMLAFHNVERLWYHDKIEKPEAINTHSDHLANRNWQINQPVFDGRGRWVTEMSEEEQRRFKSSPAQALLEQFGYASGVEW